MQEFCGSADLSALPADELVSCEFLIYVLVTAIYALYWLKQRHRTG